jgi:hypothetical protein
MSLEFTITSLRQSVHQCTGNFVRRLPKKKRNFKVTLSSGKVMLTVFWDHDGILLTEF